MTVKKNVKKRFIIAGSLFLSFVIFTVLVACFDVQPIGPEQSAVGFAAINQFVFRMTGVQLLWYHITDWLGIAALLVVSGFAAAGLWQLIQRKDIRKVDRDILVLGAFYVLVMVCYVFFERVVINCRPVILEEGLEASYPSSHTVLIVCVMATAAMQIRTRCLRKKKLCFTVDIAAALISVVTVIGRLLSGVHWFTDIVGGLLLSAALVALYAAVAKYVAEHHRGE